MTRVIVAMFVLVPSAGCLGDGGYKVHGITIETGDPETVDRESADRVYRMGQRVLDQNTFTGIDPLFHTIDQPEPALFHRGPGELFITNGLVRRCKTDAELAAVLCREMGRMMAEKRTAASVGADPDASVEPPADPLAAGTVASAPANTVAKTDGAADADRFARDLLRGCGFDPADVAKADAFLKGADRGHALSKKIAGPAPAPRWEQ